MKTNQAPLHGVKPFCCGILCAEVIISPSSTCTMSMWKLIVCKRFSHDQNRNGEGKLSKYPRAVCAKPMNPWVCANSTLAFFLECVKTRVDEGGGKMPIFQGNQQDSSMRFKKDMHKALEDIYLE